MLDFIIRHSPLFYLTQSLWRDEAFSVLVSERSISTFFTKLTFEPPLYYLLLHVWMKLFGQSEIAVRSLSLLGLTLATIIVILWSEKLFKRPGWIHWFFAILFFLNPMLIYYGFEVRTYGWYIFFATLSMYTYMNNRWGVYTLANIAGFYTHAYFLLTIGVQLLYFIIVHRKEVIHPRSWKRILSHPMIRASVIVGIAISPWVFRVILLSNKLQQSWYYPPDAQLIKSVLGNMFLGYEGTPWFLWKYTALLSLVLLGCMALALRNSRHIHLVRYLLANVFIQLGLVISISFIKPLFVNRYLIPVTVAEVFLIVLALDTIKHRWLQRGIGACIVVSMLVFNGWYPKEHAKLPIRDTLEQVNVLRQPGDHVYATSSLIFFETIYYSKDKANIYFYNPSGSAFPWYVGDAIFSDSQMIYTLPTYPNRAFLIKEDGTYTIAFQLPVLSQ